MGFKKHSEKVRIKDKYKIACEIYHQSKEENEIWFNKIVDIFGNNMSVDIITSSIDELLDKKIIASESSKREEQYKGVVFYIIDEFSCMIDNCYNLHWKNLREGYFNSRDRIVDIYLD